MTTESCQYIIRAGSSQNGSEKGRPHRILGDDDDSCAACALLFCGCARYYRYVCGDAWRDYNSRIDTVFNKITADIVRVTSWLTALNNKNCRFCIFFAVKRYNLTKKYLSLQRFSKERCRSGRSGRTRNAVYGQLYRGFESLPFRKNERS